ncbi:MULTISPECIES: lipopolysaccharide core biosynthesis protein [unclassified Pseudomonas]|uniref:lipopolysaccharide core biosynthesis protein n=1 Tax=unclassified Pseudomonas TaxID=196821 RepID=UPI0024493FF7|nr:MULTISPECIES: lipopolysaccharide core biosynthesis protein [unclassified Pseudomonas]MDG9925606.1 lipopolysaccharide core biosynthesis protein [Pseudomonas sp. GD04045]MDH0035778.1 lipopolysaccharide core biosynthesis protein [Pseudomonas sp. GD04019]
MLVGIEASGRHLQLTGGARVCLGDLASLRGKFSGSVFLVASGPSVSQFPMSHYRDWPMLAMNGSIQRFLEEGISPLFYLCDDKGVAQHKGQAVADGIRHSRYAALGLSSLEQVALNSPDALCKEELFLLERVNRLRGQAELSDRLFAWSNRRNPDISVNWSLLHQKRNRIGFSRDLCQGYFNARTIAYAALQMACHLGFSRVFMVGVDMNPAHGHFYDPEGKVIPSRLADDWDDYIRPSFDLLKEKVLGPGFQVFNLSQQSRIPESLVPRLAWDQLDAALQAAS